MLYRMKMDEKIVFEADLVNPPTEAQINAKVQKIKDAGFTGRLTVYKCIPKTTYDEKEIFAIDVV
jgi:hypothetical protein